jgi:hypothetical protein
VHFARGIVAAWRLAATYRAAKLRRYERSEPRIARREPQIKSTLFYSVLFYLCEAARPNEYFVNFAAHLGDKYDGKISLCYFSLVLFSKSALRLILK